MKNIVIALVFLVTLSSPIAAQEVEVFSFPPSDADIKLVEEGSPQAKVKLGRHYQDTQDYKEAFKWYKLAAEQGYAGAQLNLGLMYSHGGMGVLQNYTQAYMWLDVGAANGSRAAKRWRKKVAGNISAKGIEKAQAMASMCMASNYQKCGN